MKAFKETDEVSGLKVDITNCHEVEKRVCEIRPEIIIHSAGIVSSVWAQTADWYCFDVNVKGTYNISKAAKNVNAKMIYLGTTSIYKPTKELITESSEIRPMTIYNFTKYLGELTARHVLKDNVLILRLSHVYGPSWKDHSSIISNIICNVKKGYPTIVLCDKKSVKSYLFIEDAVKAIETAMIKFLSGKIRGVFNVSSHDYRPLETFVESIEYFLQTTTNSPKPIIVYRPETDYMGDHKVDSSKFRSATGWKEKTPPELGIAQCVHKIFGDNK